MKKKFDPLEGKDPGEILLQALFDEQFSLKPQVLTPEHSFYEYNNCSASITRFKLVFIRALLKEHSALRLLEEYTNDCRWAWFRSTGFDFETLVGTWVKKQLQIWYASEILDSLEAVHSTSPISDSMV